MIKNIFGSLLKMIWGLCKWPLIIIAVITVIIILMTIFWTLYYEKVKKIKPMKGEHYKVKEPNIFIKLFYLAPKQLALDRLTRNPEFFQHQGLIIYTGNQGSGKTSTMVRDIMKMQEEYPKAKTITNFGYTKQDKELRHWKQMINFKNGIQGVIIGIDEIQNWFK